MVHDHEDKHAAFERVILASRALHSVLGLTKEEHKIAAASAVSLPALPADREETTCSFLTVVTEATVASSAYQDWWNNSDQSQQSTTGYSHATIYYDDSPLSSTESCISEPPPTSYAWSSSPEVQAEDQHDHDDHNASPLLMKDMPPPETPPNKSRPKAIASSTKSTTNKLTSKTAVDKAHLAASDASDTTLAGQEHIYVVDGLSEGHYDLGDLMGAVHELHIDNEAAAKKVDTDESLLRATSGSYNLYHLHAGNLRSPFTKKEDAKHLLRQACVSGSATPDRASTTVLPEIIVQHAAALPAYWKPIELEGVPLALRSEPTPLFDRITQDRMSGEPLYWKRDLSTSINAWLKQKDVTAKVLRIKSVQLTAVPSSGPRQTLCAGVHASVFSNAVSIRLIQLQLPSSILSMFIKPDDLGWYVLEMIWSNDSSTPAYSTLLFKMSAVTQITVKQPPSRPFERQTEQLNGARYKFVLGKPGLSPAACGTGMDPWALEDFMAACARGDGVINMIPQDAD